MMSEEGVFPRLMELILERKDDNVGLHRMLLELLYEMSRMQRLRIQDLGLAILENSVGNLRADRFAYSSDRRRLYNIPFPID